MKKSNSSSKFKRNTKECYKDYGNFQNKFYILGYTIHIVTYHLNYYIILNTIIQYSSYGY